MQGNGKEFVEMHGYDTYDYGARGMYPAIGKFTTVDPLAEKRPWLTPYHYCSGNPVNRIDPDGRWDGKPSEKNKINNVPTAAQSTTGATAYQDKPKPMKMTDQQVLKAAAKQAQSQPQGEIKDANKAKLAERHNEIMNDPVAKQCLTDPTLKSVSVAGAVATTAAVAPEIANISTQIAKEKGIPILYKGAQIALENPQVTQYIAGGITGFVLSKVVPMEMQDLPSFATGLPAFDFANQVMQTGMTFKEWYQRDVAPSFNQASPK